MNMPKPTPVIAVMPLALALAASLPASGTQRVPAGFEDLVAGQIEQLEVRVFGRSAGLSPVRVSLTHVQLQSPAAVLQSLGLSEAAQAALLPSASQPLPRNAHLACRFGAPAAGCGYLPAPQDPHGVAALYDEGEGALHLFIARQWLDEEAQRPRFHRPDASAENALLHRQSFNVSGGHDYQSFAGQGAGTLGLFDHGHLAVEWNVSRQRVPRRRGSTRFVVDNGYYRQDFGQTHYLQVGRMDRRHLASPQGGTFNFGMLPLDRFQGLRLGTTRAYVDAEAIQASPLTVLLARDARVDVFDGQRLLQSFYLQAGVNTLDTRTFPFGSYTVDLRIHEAGVLVRSEQAPFEKTGDWTDDPLQWFMQLGERDERDALDREDGRAAMAGLRWSIGRHVATTIGLAEVAAVRYGETRLDLRHTYRQHELQLSASALWGSDGSHGQQHQLSYRRRASWNLYHQRLRGHACRREVVSGDGLGCVSALSASMAFPLAGGSLYLGHTRRQTWQLTPLLEPGQGGFEPLPPAFWPPVGTPSRGERRRSWQGSYGRTQRWQQFTVSTRIGAWQQQSHAGPRRGNERGLYLTLSLSRLQRGDLLNGQRRYAVDVRQLAHHRPDTTYSAAQTVRQERDGRYREMAAEVRGDNADRYSIGLGAQWLSGVGQGAVSAAYHTRVGGPGLSYSATHSSSLALGRGGLYWGAGLAAEAGLAVQVDASDDVELQGVAAELHVSGLRRQHLQLGERRLFPLASYSAHRAEVQDASTLDSSASVRVSGVGGSRGVFLQPGRLAHLAVPIDVTYTFVGNARDLAGTAVPGAHVLNAAVADTGGSGGFVIDLPQLESTLYLLQGSRLLRCPLRVRERRQVVLLVGAVDCHALTVQQLPRHISQQARVHRLLQEQALVAAPVQTTAAGDAP